MTRKMAWVGFSYSIGSFFAFFAEKEVKYTALISLSAVLILGVLLLRAEKRVRLSVSLFFFMTAIFANIVYTENVYDKIIECADSELKLAGTVSEVTELSSGKMLLNVKSEINGAKAEIICFCESLDIEVSDEISFSANLEKITDSLNFQQESYYKPQGIFLSANAENIEVLSRPSFSLKRETVKIKSDIVSLISGTLPESSAGFLCAILCGEKNLLPENVKLSLYRSGIGHIFAVSGTHVGIFASAIFLLLKLFKRSRAEIFAVTETAVLFYALFAGCSKSVLRAVFVVTIVLAAPLFHRKADLLNSLGMCAFVLTFLEPYSAADMSFVLSMAGAVGAGVIAPLVIREYKIGGRFKAVKYSLVVSFCVFVITFPFCVFWFSECSLVFWLSNLILLPLCSAALTIVLPVILLYKIPALAVILIKISGFIVQIVIVIARLIVKIPFSYVPTGSSALVFGALLYSAAVVLSIMRYKNIRFVFITAAVSVAAIAAAFAFSAVISRDDIQSVIMSDKNSAVMVLYKNKNAVIIDVEGKGGLCDAAERIVKLRGVDTVQAVVMLENPLSLITRYSSALSCAPKEFLTDEYVPRSDKRIKRFEDKLFALEAEIEITNGSVSVINSGCKFVLKTDDVGFMTLEVSDESGVRIYEFDREFENAVSVTVHENDCKVRRLDNALRE